MLNEGRFIYLYFEEGSVFPRPGTVYNKKTQKEEKNPRNINQIEKSSQSF